MDSAAPPPVAETTRPAASRSWALRSRWVALSRDSRDTLFLLAVIAWTLAPHLPRLPSWSVAFVILAMLWRARIAWLGQRLPSRWLLGAVLVLACTLTWWTHRTLLGQEAGVTLIVALTAMKTLELRARRDAFAVFFLGFFLILTQFLFSQSLLTALSMGASVWGLLTALVLAHLPVGRPTVLTAARLAARNAAMGIPIMVLLFLLFPRLAPLWGQPGQALGTTGLSSQMDLGQVAALAQDDSIAMRVRFLDGYTPHQRELYFRGPVLSQFNGQQWREAPANLWLHVLAPAESRMVVQGPPIRYELTLEPTRNSIVPLLEATFQAPKVEGTTPMNALEQRSLQWRSMLPVTDRVRISAQAWTRFEYGPLKANEALREYLELPPGSNPRSRIWASELLRNPVLASGDPQALALALLQHIRRENFRYTLSPGVYGPDAVDEFWLDRRAGFCEHFASAFVVLMRSMNVPARIVTGYQGGEFNPHDGYWVIRNRDAHAWAEYWQPGRGWLRIDPTGAVAPDRIERDLRLAAPRNLLAGAFSTVNPAWFSNARAVWEAVNNGWNQWVLNYSQGRQLNLMRSFGFESANWLDLVTALLVSIVILILAATVWIAWEQRQHDRWLLSYGRVQSLLNKSGFDVPSHWPPLTLASRLIERLGQPAQALAEALQQLDALRYAEPGHSPQKLTLNDTRRLLMLANTLAAQLESQNRIDQR